MLLHETDTMYDIVIIIVLILLCTKLFLICARTIQFEPVRYIIVLKTIDRMAASYRRSIGGRPLLEAWKKRIFTKWNIFFLRSLYTLTKKRLFFLPPWICDFST